MATFTNQATLTYNGGTASSNITTGELLEVLTATKTAVVPTYRSGRPHHLSYHAGQQPVPADR